MCVCLYGTTMVDRAENFLAMVGGDILYNVGKAIINHPFGNGNHSTYLWNLCNYRWVKILQKYHIWGNKHPYFQLF